MWVLYILIFSVIIGFYSVLRKKAAEKTNILFVLAFTTTLGFLFVSWSAKEAMAVSSTDMILLIVKAIIVSMLLLAFCMQHLPFRISLSCEAYPPTKCNFGLCCSPLYFCGSSSLLFV